MREVRAQVGGGRGPTAPALEEAAEVATIGVVHHDVELRPGLETLDERDNVRVAARQATGAAWGGCGVGWGAKRGRGAGGGGRERESRDHQ